MLPNAVINALAAAVNAAVASLSQLNWTYAIIPSGDHSIAFLAVLWLWPVAKRLPKEWGAFG
jgi:hypothetical protein